MKNIIVSAGFLLTSLIPFAQKIGSKVSFSGTDGKLYTGAIKEIQGDRYKIKYDGYDFEAWAEKAQFTVIGQNDAATESTQKTGNWKVGDKVEAYDMSNGKWYNGTITIVLSDRNPIQWRVSFDDPKGHTFEYLSLTAQQIRPRGAKLANRFALNNRVDVSYANGSPRGRATVIEMTADGNYKVHYDGCKAGFLDETVDGSQLKPASIVSSAHPDIAAVIGKWAMFVYSYPNTVIRGNDIYREYGTGAKAPPLQINGDGTYLWYDEYNKPPVKGRWSTHAKIEGVTMGTESINGIVLKDSYGIEWKVYKDRADHIEARKMCSGETQGGTRIR